MWLFRTRLCKTRSEAQSLINRKKVRLTRSGEVHRVTKPHFQIRPGDQVSFMRHRSLVQVEMVAPGTRRGPAPEARSLYLDLQDTGCTDTSG